MVLTHPSEITNGKTITARRFVNPATPGPSTQIELPRAYVPSIIHEESDMQGHRQHSLEEVTAGSCSATVHTESSIGVL